MVFFLVVLAPRHASALQLLLDGQLDGQCGVGIGTVAQFVLVEEHVGAGVGRQGVEVGRNVELDDEIIVARVDYE